VPARRLRQALTYANVVSTLCLFLLLGGSAYAALSITGKDVKNGSLTGVDVRNRSLSGKELRVRSVSERHVAPEALGTRHVQGLRAHDFAAGELPHVPAPPPPGFTRTVVRSASQPVDLFSGTSTITVRADCLPGEQATGGGGEGPLDEDVMRIHASRPVGNPPHGWEVRIDKSSTSQGKLVTAHVLCAS
jgi:hypothetical protein